MCTCIYRYIHIHIHSLAAPPPPLPLPLSFSPSLLTHLGADSVFALAAPDSSTPVATNSQKLAPWYIYYINSLHGELQSTFGITPQIPKKRKVSDLEYLLYKVSKRRTFSEISFFPLGNPFFLIFLPLQPLETTALAAARSAVPGRLSLFVALL